jgi:hypothetical protein
MARAGASRGSRAWTALILCTCVGVVTPIAVEDAAGSFGTNSCPAWLAEYETIRDRPPVNYSVVSSCGGAAGMVWAEPPRDEQSPQFGPEGLNYVRVRLGYYQGTLVTVETLLPLPVLAHMELGRRGLGALESVTGVQIDHVDVRFSSGHRGMPEPHYSVQLHLTDHATHEAFECQTAEGGGWARFINFFK